MPGFCYFVFPLMGCVLGVQYLSMGMYQISRLHYCFSAAQVHHEKGYPQWLFLAMSTVGVCLLLSWVLFYAIAVPLPAACGIDADTNCFTELNAPLVSPTTWSAVHFALYHVWDLATLGLYALKIHSFRKYKAEQEEVYRRIMCILQRVAILTLFYDTVFALTTCVVVLFGFPPEIEAMPIKWSLLVSEMGSALVVVLFSVSMLMMLEHNTAAYIRFLRLVRRLRLNFVFCCCCTRIIEQQLDQFATGQLRISVKTQTSDAPKSETDNASPKSPLYRTEVRFEASLETVA